jgi:plasmid maintenance system antidote protein VapI
MRGNAKSFTLFSWLARDWLINKQAVMNEPPHIGHLIKEELNRQGRSVTWFAAQLQCSRQNVYGIFENPWIYTDTLWKICQIMDFDFFELYSNCHQKMKTTSKT